MGSDFFCFGEWPHAVAANLAFILFSLEEAVLYRKALSQHDLFSRDKCPEVFFFLEFVYFLLALDQTCLKTYINRAAIKVQVFLAPV